VASTPIVTVVDYGMGNLLSVTRAFEHCGARPVLSERPEEVAKADYLVLPGVGAFADGMAGLRQRGLVEAVREQAATGRPLLAICLGMQMLLAESTEFGRHEGLNLIAGVVDEIPRTAADGTPHKVPHIGWAALERPAGVPADWWAGTLLEGIDPGTAAYFVHSFTAIPDASEARLADAFYNGRRVSAVVRRGNVFGTQFHPEKSGPAGLRMISRFLAPQ
jgi:glutamine amidotransferase